MTTASATQTQVYTIPATTQLPLYTSQQVSPASSASPTSPRLNDALPQYAPNPSKQLRPLKSPLYVPAVLRPNDYYSQSPMTPPKSLQGSLDNLAEHEVDAEAAAQRGLELALQHSFVQEPELSQVTGPPTREHWKPDDASPNCDSPQCNSSFNIFVRKHHCRHCGHIFCAAHAKYSIPLDQAAKFHPDGTTSRACDTCHKQYQRWDTARSVRRKNSDHSDESTIDSGTTTPIDVKHGQRVKSGQPEPRQTPNSAPREWAWSTF